MKTQQSKRVRVVIEISLCGDLSREDLAAGKELNGGVNVEESSRVDQWSCVSLDLGIVPPPLQKGIHLAYPTHTNRGQYHTFHPKFKIIESEKKETSNLFTMLVPETCRRPSRSWYLFIEATELLSGN